MKFNANETLILTGTPGSGKTTAANIIAQLPESPKVHPHADDFWHFIKAGAIAPWQPEAHAQNATLMDVLAGAAVGLLKADISYSWMASLGLGFLTRSEILVQVSITSSFARIWTKQSDGAKHEVEIPLWTSVRSLLYTSSSETWVRWNAMHFRLQA